MGVRLFLFIASRTQNIWCVAHSMYYMVRKFCRGVVVITTTQLHSTKPELRFCVISNPGRGVSEIRYGEDL